MKKISIIASDALPLPLKDKSPLTITKNNKEFNVFDKCLASTSQGNRTWAFANILSKYFDVTVLVPDINYPGKDNIDFEKISFKITSFNYESAKLNWSEELDRKLLQSDFVIIQTIDGAGFKNCSVLPGNIHVIVDGYNSLLTQIPIQNLYMHRIQRKVMWEKLIADYTDLLIRSNCLLYSTSNQRQYYEGQFFMIGKLGWKAFKFSTLLKVSNGITLHDKIIKQNNNDINLLWYGAIYPWYNSEILLDLLGGQNINIDFVGIKHPRFNKYYKNFIDKYEKNIDNYHNINVYESYTNSVDYSKYDAGICISNEWIENNYSTRYRLLEMLSHGLPIITNTNIKNEIPFLDRAINEFTLFDIVPFFSKLKKENLTFPDEEFNLLHTISWENTLYPLIDYISNFKKSEEE
jgi:hypothetical protein